MFAVIDTNAIYANENPLKLFETLYSNNYQIAIVWAFKVRQYECK